MGERLYNQRYCQRCGSGGTGRRARLRILWPKNRGGSSPLSRTISSLAVPPSAARARISLPKSLHPRLNCPQTLRKSSRSPMERSVASLLSLYHPEDPLERASTIPSPWYFDPRIARLENEQVFAHTWQVAGRVDQVRGKGHFFTTQLQDEPIVGARGEEGILRAFYNVCRHHAAAVVTESQGCTQQ